MPDINPALTDDLQAALDNAPAGPVTLVLADGDYDLGAGAGKPPLWVRRDKVRIVGQSPDTSRILTDWRVGSHGALVLGDVPLAGDERGPSPLITGLVAYHLSPGRRIWDWSGAASLNTTGYLTWDAWSGLDAFTLEFAATFNRQQTDVGRLFGLGDGDVTPPSPWQLDSSLHIGQYVLRVSLTSGAEAQVRVPAGSYLSGLQMVTIQVRLSTGEAWGWVNDQPVSVTLANFSPGMRAVPNSVVPFAVWGDVDWSVAGLRWQPGLRYTPGAPITGTDNGRYRAYGGTCYLLWCDPTLDSGRWVKTNTGWAALLESAHFDPAHTVSGFRLESVGIVGHNRLGDCLSLGAAYDPLVQDVGLSGGAHGVGSSWGAVAYTVTVRDSYLDGWDAAYYGRAQTVRLHDLHLGPNGRRAIRLEATGGVVRDVFAENPVPACEAYLSVVGDDDDVMLRVESMTVDDESPRPPSFLAPYLISQPHAGAWTVAIRDLAVDAQGTRPVALLSASGTGWECNLLADNVRSYGAVMLTNNPGGRWSVAASNCSPSA